MQGDRWFVGLMLAALVLLFAAPAAPAAQRTDPAMAVQRSMVCREASFSIDEARRDLIAQGWPDVTRPSIVSDKPTSYQFDRNGIWVVLAPFNASLAECHAHAHVPDGTVLSDIVPALTAALGRVPDSTDEGRVIWNNVAGRKVELALVDGEWFNIFFKPANAQPAPDKRALAQAPDAASTMPSALPGEIADAAAACLAAVASTRIDAKSIRRAGWANANERGGIRVYSRDGSNVRIFTSGAGHCVVDAYGKRRDSFDAIRDAIRTRLSSEFGDQAVMGEATGEARSFSRGQGFTVGKRIGVLSSEQRDGGLSIRFTVMSIQ